MYNQSLIARSPGKLILSGEHSVLYKQPAIAMAINLYTTTCTKLKSEQSISFKLLDIEYAKTHTIQALMTIKKRLQDNYLSFLNGQCHIRDVIKRPFELLQFCVTNLIDKLNIHLPSGVEIKVDSSIPIGCGMGSSAAAIISTLHALNMLFKLKLNPILYLNLAKDIENLQHGKSSGLDLHLSTYGGCLKFQNGASQAINFPNFPIAIINTGKPLSSTGECVAKTKQKLQSKSLQSEFAETTNTLEKAILEKNLTEFSNTIDYNQQLLEYIGIVPEKISKFIKELNKQGTSAKVCGSGAAYGDNAGVVMITGNINCHTVVNNFGYTIQEISQDVAGTIII